METVTTFEIEGYRFGTGDARPRLTITHDGTVVLSAMAWGLLGRPTWARLYLDPDRLAIAVTGAEPRSEYALTCLVSGATVIRVRLHARRFIRDHDLTRYVGRIYEVRALRHPTLGPVLVADLEHPIGTCRRKVRRCAVPWDREPCA